MGSSCCSAKGATEVTKRVIQSPDSTSKKSEHPAAPQETNQQEMEHNGDDIQEEEASAGNAGLDEFEQIDDSLIRPSNTVYPYPEILAIPVKEHLLLPSMKASPVNGLVNLGNNCHLNVVLQLLMHTPGLREYFLSNLHVKEHVTEANPFPEGVAGRIGELVQLYHSYNDTALAPHKLLETIISESSGLFDPLSKEDDAINVLCYLLQNLHHRLRKNYFGQGEGVESDIPAAGMSSGKPTLPEMFNLDVSELRLLSTGLLPNNFEENKFAKLESKGPKKNSQGKPERTAIEMAGIKSFREHLQKGSSVICDTMLGQLLHKIHCADCGFYLVQFKPFFCLELPLPEDHETTDLRQILQNMASPKEIVGRFINCPTCKGSRKMLASTEIYKLPPVLYVHFQRFVTGLPKNPTLVQVDLNGEDLSDLEAGSTESPTQNLKKIYKPFFYIHHFGQEDSGHYTCSLFDNHDWTVVGDAVVKVLRDPEALQDRSNLFVAFKLTPLHSIKSLNLEFNWPYSTSKLLPQEIPSNVKRKVAPTATRMSLGVRVYKLVTDASNGGQHVLSHRFAWKDAPTARGYADGNVNRLESIKSLGGAEDDESYYGITTPKARQPTVRMTFNRGSRNRLKSIDPQELNSPLSMLSPNRKAGQPAAKRPVGFSGFALAIADQKPAKKSQSPPL